MSGVMIGELFLLDAAAGGPLGAVAAVSAAGLAPRASRAREKVLAGRLFAARAQGRARWAMYAEDRAWIHARFALPLKDTPHERRLRRVSLRHYALTQQCLMVEGCPTAREATGVVLEAGPPPQGAVFAFAHSPAMWLFLFGLTNAGLPFSPVVADWYWDDPGYGVRTRALARAGGAAIPADHGFDGLLEIIARGGHLALAVDVPGSHPVRFLGKDARIRSGAVRLALAADVPIVPVRGGFRHGRPVAIVGAPIAPRADAEGLLAEVLAAVEAPLLARPELFMPYTGELWPDLCAPHRAAYDEEQPAAEVTSAS
jgi:hypothetical protein